jgi:hypothetical protein
MDVNRIRCETAEMSIIPICREQITPEWLISMLSSVGDCQIAALDFEEMRGHNPDLSQLFRIRIDYSMSEAGHPEVVIAKIPPVDDVVRLREAAYGPYTGELGSYRLLQEFQGGSIAQMYGADEDPSENTACFVFEDLGALPIGQKYARIDFEVAKATLDLMASFHGRFWEDESLGSASWIHSADWSLLFNQDPLDSALGWKVIQADDRFEKSGGLVIAGEYLGKQFSSLQIAMGTRTNTLTHNDFHQGNVLLRQTPAGSQPVIIDWQMPAFAGATNDLAKFMMTAVPFEILANQETELVLHYFEQLKSNGGRNYSFDECWRDYRRAQVVTFANYANSCYKTSTDGDLIESSGDSTHSVIKALTLADPAEMREILP